MKFELATEADIPALVEIWHDGWHQAHAEVVPQALVTRRVRAEFDPRVRAHLGQTRVAHEDGQVAGFFMLDGDEIYQFYLARAFQGRGKARPLLMAAESALGAGHKWLACSVGNTQAAGFYEACGWHRAATLPYEVETSDGPLVINVWRYEKLLRAD
ncbi:N-acetyltransferase [Sulfitobacter sp. SK012]|uniref:GNAT family N-acetyltransferase n=1 Tax=Sulfitobacter sp. SK012 TaxID=1389005 RepID=UPI000E0A59D4|nr:GNAT family N-acetyltransferase [Sulfitobacter sp. SK012]AXI48744.1 N-acetyltransferase [Sulfitobacter sp. SK012]